MKISLLIIIGLWLVLAMCLGGQLPMWVIVALNSVIVFMYARSTITNWKSNRE